MGKAKKSEFNIHHSFILILLSFQRGHKTKKIEHEKKLEEGKS